MADASFQQEFLVYHNLYRSKHNTSPLTLSEELTASAQEWANHLLENKKTEHRVMEDGENIYFINSLNPITLTGKETVDVWYSENKDYNWSNPETSFNTGHFTQVVWKDSTELGVGMATDGNMVIVVGQYRPRGNIMGDFEKNVLPLVASFQLEFLDAHNMYRSKHNTPPLTLSMEMTASAQKWAESMLESHGMEYRNMEDAENIYFINSFQPVTVTGKEAVDAWYSENNEYNWSSPDTSFNTGHFTQVVWKDSTELGVGMATDGYRVFVVGQYRPRGNIMGEFKKNVLPLV